LDFIEDIQFYSGRVNFVDYDYSEEYTKENYIYGFDINTGSVN
jgi:hypothetical protein